MIEILVPNQVPMFLNHVYVIYVPCQPEEALMSHIDF